MLQYDTVHSFEFLTCSLCYKITCSYASFCC